MPAPDFPTGGEIVFPEGGFREMYRTGRGGVTLRGVTSIETVKTGSGARGSTREAVVISSIPYQTNKAALCEQIAELVNSRAIEGVADVRDESDRDGMRVVIELRRSADAEFTREQLYARTKLQTRVSVNVVGLVGEAPEGGTRVGGRANHLVFAEGTVSQSFQRVEEAERWLANEGWFGLYQRAVDKRW